MPKLKTAVMIIFAAFLCSHTLNSAGGSKPKSIPARLLPETVMGDFENKPGQMMEVARVHRIFYGKVINRGKFKTTDATVTFTRSYTENGAFFSDPSTNNFIDLIVGVNGYLTGGNGDLFIVSGNFNNGSTQNILWSTASAELDFKGGLSHQFLLAGADSGPSSLGYSNNFAWGTVRLYSGQSLVLGDGNAKSGSALYTNALVLDDGISQISTISGNGSNIYYNPLNSLNNYLAGGTYALQGGGAIMPVQAAVKITSISVQANKHVILQCIGMPKQNHTVQATADLSQAFTPVATVVAGSDGTFQYEDTNAGSFTRRFYRISYP